MNGQSIIKVSTEVNNHELASMLFYAFRYCLGRQSYAVSDCVGWLIFYWPIIPLGWKKTMHKEIAEAIELGGAGMDMDVEQWENILELPLEEAE